MLATAAGAEPVATRGGAMSGLFGMPVLRAESVGAIPAARAGGDGRRRDRVELGGARVDLLTAAETIGLVRRRLTRPAGRLPAPRRGEAAPRGAARPLVLASANVDHVHHFGRRGPARAVVDAGQRSADWLVLPDGMPLVWAARRLCGAPVSLVPGSDLLPALLALAADCGARVGFLGGRQHMHDQLRVRLAADLPTLHVAGCWAPGRAEITEAAAAAGLAAEVRRAGVDLLAVSFGKPWQERWISEYAVEAGAGVYCAFGAAADFVAGTARRAPAVVRRSGLEWSWRLAREPRRLARRYLVQGPPSLWDLVAGSRTLPEDGG